MELQLGVAVQSFSSVMTLLSAPFPLDDLLFSILSLQPIPIQLWLSLSMLLQMNQHYNLPTKHVRFGRTSRFPVPATEIQFPTAYFSCSCRPDGATATLNNQAGTSTGHAHVIDTNCQQDKETPALINNNMYSKYQIESKTPSWTHAAASYSFWAANWLLAHINVI